MSVSVSAGSICRRVVHVIWKPHKIPQGMGKSRKCLKAGRLCDTSVECHLEEKAPKAGVREPHMVAGRTS
jgi:hypothetical protein